MCVIACGVNKSTTGAPMLVTRTYTYGQKTITKQWELGTATLNCVECGVWFTAIFQASRRVYCSEKCGTAATKKRSYKTGLSQRVKAKRDGATVIEKFNRIEILERDNYTCHICKQPINPKLNDLVTHRMSGTMDHILPIKQGGQHTRDNVKAAHMICNARRQRGPKDARKRA